MFHHLSKFLAALACGAILAGCALRVTTAAPAFSPDGQAAERADTGSQPAEWWETYGGAPRGP